MFGYDRSDDYQPLTYIGRYPLYVTTLLVVLHVAAAVACCFLMAFQAAEVVSGLLFSSANVLGKFWIWEWVSYAFVHLPRPDSIGMSLLSFFLEMYMLMIFGRDLEKFLGRKMFLILYICVLLVTPLLLTLGGAISHYALTRGGSQVLHLAIFIGFATIYPNVALFLLGIPAKWMAWIALAAYTLGSIADRDWNTLTVLWASAGVAYGGVRYAGAGGDFTLLSNLREYLPRKTVPSGVKPRLQARRTAPQLADRNAGSNSGGASDVHESIDPLLDKISKHGLASLTHSERAILERARASLLRKERGG